MVYEEEENTRGQGRRRLVPCPRQYSRRGAKKRLLVDEWTGGIHFSIWGIPAIKSVSVQEGGALVGFVRGGDLDGAKRHL